MHAFMFVLIHDDDWLMALCADSGCEVDADALSEALGDARRLGSCQYYSWGHLLEASREIPRHMQPHQALLDDPPRDSFCNSRRHPAALPDYIYVH